MLMMLAVVADDHRILERRAQRVAGRPQPLDVPHEAEGARARDIAAEHVGIDVGLERLPADRRIVEVDLDLEAGAGMRPELGPGRTVVDAHRLEHADVAAFRVLLLDAGLIECVDECRTRCRRGSGLPSPRFRS